jgi:hypothetical protein
MKRCMPNEGLMWLVVTRNCEFQSSQNSGKALYQQNPTSAFRIKRKNIVLRVYIAILREANSTISCKDKLCRRGIKRRGLPAQRSTTSDTELPLANSRNQLQQSEFHLSAISSAVRMSEWTTVRHQRASHPLGAFEGTVRLKQYPYMQSLARTE